MKKSWQAPCLHSKISGAIEIPLAVDHRVSRLPQRLSADGLRLTLRFWHNAVLDERIVPNALTDVDCYPGNPSSSQFSISEILAEQIRLVDGVWPALDRGTE